VDGGKITEKANGLGNSNHSLSKDLSNIDRISAINDKQNSVWSKRNYSINLNIIKNYSTCSSNVDVNLDVMKDQIRDINYFPNSIKEYTFIQSLVFNEQVKLVKLAEKYGIRSKKVYDLQVLLTKSRLFRVYAILNIINNKDSETSGIDN
jgi:hypothetical protein